MNTIQPAAHKWAKDETKPMSFERKENRIYIEQENEVNHEH